MKIYQNTRKIIHKYTKESAKSLTELISIIFSALFLANTLTGSVELKSILSISTIFIVIFKKKETAWIGHGIIISGLIAATIDSIVNGWKNLFIDIFWLSAKDYFEINKEYAIFFTAAFLFIFSLRKILFNFKKQPNPDAD